MCFSAFGCGVVCVYSDKDESAAVPGGPEELSVGLQESGHCRSSRRCEGQAHDPSQYDHWLWRRALR